MANTETAKQETRKFADAFAEAVAHGLNQSIDAAWRLTVLESPDFNKRQGKAVHFRLTLEGSLLGDCFVEFYEPHLAELACKILNEPISDFNDSHRDAVEKVLIASMQGLCSALAGDYGAFSVAVALAEGLAFGGMFVIALNISGDQQSDMPALLYFDAPLLAALSDKEPAKSAADRKSLPIDPTNLKLVMDVELNVSLRFGQRQLPLRDVLELTSGSVVELDRQVDEPVELLLDGKIIARGEAVIVDGNYGLRVTEIPEPIAAHLLR